MIHDYDNGGALRVLVCSANMGNAEPTLSSMKSWIPELGLTENITTLNGDPMAQLGAWRLMLGSFDVVYWSLCAIVFPSVIED